MSAGFRRKDDRGSSGMDFGAGAVPLLSLSQSLALAKQSLLGHVAMAIR
jgi:hypothetical protein